MKPKKLKWVLIILAVLVLASVGYVLWGTPAALELLYQDALTRAAEPVAVLGSILPEKPWNSMTWRRAVSGIGQYESGQYDPEEMYTLLENVPLYPTEEEYTEKRDGYLLLVCNPDIAPVTRYTVWIDAQGGISIESDQNSLEDEPQYYRTDPEVIDALDETLLGYCLRDVTDIGNDDTLGALLPELPWSQADWILCDAQEHIIDQGKFDPEQMLELANKTALESSDTGLNPEKKSVTLLLSNPGTEPLQRCDIYIDELGAVEFRIRVWQGYLVERYYQADRTFYDTLMAMLYPPEE